jgi:hypothetical protein
MRDLDLDKFGSEKGITLENIGFNGKIIGKYGENELLVYRRISIPVIPKFPWCLLAYQCLSLFIITFLELKIAKT